MYTYMYWSMFKVWIPTICNNALYWCYVPGIVENDFDDAL